VTPFRLRVFLRNSLWLTPLLFGVAGWALSVALIELDRATPSVQALDFSATTATQLLQAIAGAAVAFTGFAFSVLLLVVQLASSQLSPRATRVAYRGWLSRISLGLWVGTLTYSVSLLESVTGDFVPQISVAVAGILVFVSVLVFLLLIGRTSRILRPGPMAELIAREGRKVIAGLHPEPLAAGPPPDPPPLPDAGEAWPLRHEGRAGVVVAMDVRGLVRDAQRAGAVVVAARRVGEQVAPGEVLLRVHGSGARGEGWPRNRVSVEVERTFELDPLYAFRILTDIAIRALSPAVNDPTTAVQVLKRTDDLIADVARRRLGPTLHRDGDGVTRLVLDNPVWEDYVEVAFAEIVRFGAGSPQVSRALLAMLGDLRDRVPEERRGALDDRLAILDEAVAHEYPGPLARAEALVSDRHGFG
jgi:uncharacterized membrane protein